MDANGIRIDLRLPDDELEESDLLEAAAQAFPGDLIALFHMNWLLKDQQRVQDEHREGDGWA